MNLLTVLNSCVEIKEGSWLTRADDLTFKGEEPCIEIAQYKVLLSAAKHWCYSQSNPAAVSAFSPDGDLVVRFNDRALKLLNLRRHSPHRLSCREFWQNQQDYWEWLRDLRQQGSDQSKIRLISFDGVRLGEVGVVGSLLPDSPIFISRTT